jgi:hypothetical protein
MRLKAFVMATIHMIVSGIEIIGLNLMKVMPKNTAKDAASIWKRSFVNGESEDISSARPTINRKPPPTKIAKSKFVLGEKMIASIAKLASIATPPSNGTGFLCHRKVLGYETNPPLSANAFTIGVKHRDNKRPTMK